MLRAGRTVVCAVAVASVNAFKESNYRELSRERIHHRILFSLATALFSSHVFFYILVAIIPGSYNYRFKIIELL